MCVHATIRINSHTSLLCQLGGPWSNEALEAISMPNIQMFIYLPFFKENTLLWHEKRHQSTRFIFVWKLAKQYVGILFPWKWEDPIGSLSTAQSEKTTTNKKGKGRKKKSHDLGNHLILWIIYQEVWKENLCFYTGFEFIVVGMSVSHWRHLSNRKLHFSHPMCKYY